jgi:hypothetical protein
MTKKQNGMKFIIPIHTCLSLTRQQKNVKSNQDYKKILTI